MIETPLLIKEIIEHPLAACTVVTILGGFYWKVFVIVAAVRKATTNELPHIQANGEAQLAALERILTTMQLLDSHEYTHHEAQMALLTAILNK